MVRNIVIEKDILREKYKKIRREIDKRYREEANEKIFENLISLPEIERADIVLTFISFGTEPDTLKFAEHIISKGKKLAAAKCTEKKGIMNFHIIESLSDLEKGTYGILEPKPEIPFLSDDELKGMRAVCVVPGLSFSGSGHRLGYGAGYYDRFLSSHKKIRSIGICFDLMMSEDIPVEEFDVPVDMVVTDKKITEITYER